MPKLERIPAEKATLAQLREFVDLENLDVTSEEKKSKERLLAKIEQAGIAAGGIYVAVGEVAAPLPVSPMAQTSWDKDREKWCRVRVPPASEGKPDVPAWVGHNGVPIRIPRNKFIHVRERYLEALKDTVATVPVHTFGEDGIREDREQMAQIEQVPYSFFGFTGYCDEGPPPPEHVEAGDLVVKAKVAPSVEPPQ